MKKADIDSRICGSVARDLSVSTDDVRNAIVSYFGCMLSDARKLPFADNRRIYTRKLFDSLSKIYNIPFIGRIGPSYSRYLKWRTNTVNRTMTARSTVAGMVFSEEDIETLADAILSGKEIPEIKKRPRKDMFDNVWLVDTAGKKLARQVITKNKVYVQD